MYHEYKKTKDDVRVKKQHILAETEIENCKLAF